MPYTSPTAWEVRLSGHAQNGGGFDAAFGGTDYSQQDAPQAILTDCTFSVGSTTVTSTGGGFTSQMVGNVMWFGGIGNDYGRRQITAFVSGTQVTIDSNAPGTEAGAGIVRVGGGILVFQNGLDFNPVPADGNKIW